MRNKKIDLEIFKLTAKEALLSFFDLSSPFFESSRLYRKSIQKYLSIRQIDRSHFLERIRYLKRKGYIQSFTKNKEKFIELTKKGKKYSQIAIINKITIKRPPRWDKKWRIIIFDIPEKMHYARDIFRDHIKRLNFLQIQKSVYVFPFECTEEISYLSNILKIQKFVIIMLSEIIQGEQKIIKQFLNKEMIETKDLK